MKRIPLLPVACILVALLACKKKEEEQSLPDALPPPTAETPAAPAPTTAAPAAPAATDDDTPTTPTTKPKPKDAGTKDSGTAAKSDAGTKPPSTECFSKCQAALSTCLTPQAGKDGGLPKFADPAQCQAAFQACQTACK